MIFAIGMVLAFIGWVLRPVGLQALKVTDSYLKFVGSVIIIGLSMMVLSVAIMAWGFLP